MSTLCEIENKLPIPLQVFGDISEMKLLAIFLIALMCVALIAPIDAHKGCNIKNGPGLGICRRRCRSRRSNVVCGLIKMGRQRKKYTYRNGCVMRCW